LELETDMFIVESGSSVKRPFYGTDWATD